MSTMKTLSELTICDNFLFAAVMQQADNCRTATSSLSAALIPLD
ncbi:MAG: hypothetical protein ACI4DN_11325 [Lachnospiraceae bacterium]